MDTAIVLTFVAVSIVLILVAFVVGQKTVKHQEQLNNDKVLKERAMIDKDLQDKKAMVYELEKTYQSKKQLMNDAQASAQRAYDERIKALDAEYQKKNKELDQQIQKRKEEQFEQYQESVQQMEQDKQLVEQELDSLKRTRDAAIEAARKEREIQEQPDKYCIPMTQDEIGDIEYLDTVMPRLKFPEVLGKCIWSVFFQKKMKNFLTGILGQNEVCGVYKITDRLTGEAYVGQSVKVKSRFMEHIKCGIGAMPASNANQLYSAMRRDGVWNFSFELLAECPKEELDDKERFFIDLYSTDSVGLNSKRGNQSNTLKE